LAVEAANVFVISFDGPTEEAFATEAGGDTIVATCVRVTADRTPLLADAVRRRSHCTHAHDATKMKWFTLIAIIGKSTY
jgi:hypothetical protein